MLQQPSHTAVVSYDYEGTYPSSLQSVKVEPGLQQAAAQQVKTEPTALLNYAGDYYVDDDENNYGNYDMYYDQADGIYTDHGGSYSTSGHFADNSANVVEHRKPRAHKVLLVHRSFLVEFVFLCEYQVTC